MKRTVRFELQRARVNRAQRGRTASLVLVAVSSPADDEFVTPCTMNEQRQQVALGAAGAEDGVLGSKEGRSEFLKAIDRRIFAVDVVADVRRGHSGPHCPGRFRDRIASQVDLQRIAPNFAARTCDGYSTLQDELR